jgi:hypothetical protein
VPFIDRRRGDWRWSSQWKGRPACATHYGSGSMTCADNFIERLAGEVKAWVITCTSSINVYAERGG